MKKLLSLVLVIVMAFSCSLMLTACSPDNPGDGGGNGGGNGEELTRAEIATIYKEVAESAWEKIGFELPAGPALMSATFPDNKIETTDSNRIANIKMNAKGGFGVIYMLGLLYENDNFVLTNGIAKFNASVNVFGNNMDFTFILKSSLDVANDKVYLEHISEVSGQPGLQQYGYSEIYYDFDTKEVKGFRFISNQATSEGLMSVDMALTTDGKYMWYDSADSTDAFFQAVEAQKLAYATSAESVQLRLQNFATECQVYFDILYGAMGGAN